MSIPIKESELIVTDGKIYHLGLRPDQLARNIIVVGDPKRADIVAKHFDSISHQASNREYVTRTGAYKGMPVSVIATGIGPDNTEIAVVEAFGLNEFDLETRVRKQQAKPLTIIRVGTCGGPQLSIPVGTLAISTYAIGLDNTGLFYDSPLVDETAKMIEEESYRILTDATPNERRFKGKIHPYVSKASDEVASALLHTIKSQYALGITVTSSGFFGPQGREIPGLPITIPRLQEHLATLNVGIQQVIGVGDEATVDSSGSLQVINFEMESSLLFHLSRQLGYRAGSVCAIIANRPQGTFLSDYSEAVERGIQGALSALYDMYSNEK